MLKSMTGYGQGTAHDDEGELTASIRTFNSRYAEVKIRGVDLDPETELALRKQVGERMERGSILVALEWAPNEGKTVSLDFDRERFEAIDDLVTSIQREYGRHIELSDLLKAEQLLRVNENHTVKPKLVFSAVTKAMNQVEEMRKAEGKEVEADLKTRLSQLEQMVDKIEREAAASLTTRKAALEERLSRLLGNVDLDSNRLMQEVVILADRSDISEELVRLRSHLEQFRQLMEKEEPVGRRLHFLLQEIGREINTLGSKNGTGKIIKIVVEFKNNLEQIREQVQNVI
ncbi:MAG: YicC/YloC family endoribonuclease [Fidelibacterota bacterium]